MTSNQSVFLDGLLLGTQVGLISAGCYTLYENGDIWKPSACLALLAVIVVIQYRRKK